MPQLYHYTNFWGMLGIINDKRIGASETNAHYGKGVYMTSMAGEFDVEEILVNNWGGGTTFVQDNKDKVMFYFKISSDDLPGVVSVGVKDGRDVWLYPADIDLKSLIDNKKLRIGHIKNESEWSSHTANI